MTADPQLSVLLERPTSLADKLQTVYENEEWSFKYDLNASHGEFHDFYAAVSPLVVKALAEAALVIAEEGCLVWMQDGCAEQCQPGQEWCDNCRVNAHVRDALAGKENEDE